MSIVNCESISEARSVQNIPIRMPAGPTGPANRPQQVITGGAPTSISAAAGWQKELQLCISNYIT